MTFSSDYSILYTSTVLLGPSGPPSAYAALPLHPCLQTSYPPYAHSISSPFVPSPPLHVPDCFSIRPAFSSPLTSSGFFNGMLEISEPGALNYYTLFCPIWLTIFVSGNLTLIHFPLFGFLDSLLCNLIVPTTSLAFSFLMPCMLPAVSSFLPVRAYPSLNSLLLFLCLTPTLIMEVSTSH